MQIITKVTGEIAERFASFGSALESPASEGARIEASYRDRVEVWARAWGGSWLLDRAATRSADSRAPARTAEGWL